MTPEALLEQFDVMAEASNGVQKLRELILQLAVRGKLVPQDPRDEPADVLLEHIASEKAKLVRDGRIDKQRELPPVTADQVPFDLPVGWKWTTLETLGTVNPRNDLPDDLVVAFCPMSSLPEDYRGSLMYEERIWRQVKRGYTHFAENDVVVAKITPCFQNGKAAVMRGLPGGAGAGTTELHVFRPINGMVVPEYVLAFLKSPGFVRGGVQTMTGTAGQQRVSRDYFALSPFPLPPLVEQLRIVAKVDELMALCDQLEERQRRRADLRARANRSALHHLTAASDHAELADHWQLLRENFHLLYETPESVAELRHAVLQLAVRGKLVPQDLSDEPAAELLARIVAEREQLFQEGKIGKGKPLPPISEDEVPFEVPKGWEWVRLGAISAVAGGIQKTPRRTPVSNHYPYLRVANVQRGSLDLKEIEQFELTDGELDKWRLETGDLLIVEGNGSEDEIGRCARWSGEISNCVHQNHLIRVRPIHKDVGELILRFLNSPDGIAEMKRLAVTTSGLFNLSVGKITNIIVPVPPYPEQHRIVTNVDELMALCDALEARLTRAREKSAHLAASVVHHFTAA